MLTGDEFFPGGMGTFDIEQNNFLVFEQGPSQNMTLQWATYRDASDQTSLSRIWGGIHPPIDDIRGRIIGDKIGKESFNLALNYFNGTLSIGDEEQIASTKLYPVPFKNEFNITSDYNGLLTVELYSIDGKQVISNAISKNSRTVSVNTQTVSPGFYIVKLRDEANDIVMIKKIVKN